MQEVKGTPEQVEHVWEQFGYAAYWHPAERAGYSGALLLTRIEPEAVRVGLGIPEFDSEGRLIEADYGPCTVVTSYFPNAGRGIERMQYKLDYYAAFLRRMEELRGFGRRLVFMGDFNVANTEMDVARPEEGLNGTGFLPIEREWIDRIEDAGYVDTFRALHPEQRDVYSYWDAW